MTLEAFTELLNAYCEKQHLPWNQHIAKIEPHGTEFRVYYTEPKSPMGALLPYADYRVNENGEITSIPK